MLSVASEPKGDLTPDQPGHNLIPALVPKPPAIVYDRQRRLHAKPKGKILFVHRPTSG